MRVVIAPVEDERLVPAQESPRGTDEILYVSAGHPSPRCDPRSNTLENIQARYPAGWSPDALIFWSLEYYPVPAGIELADGFTVGVIGDWNLGGQAFQLVGGAFDMLVADRNGCARLRSTGFENAYYAPLWAFDSSLHRRLPDVERDLDIVMVGNFNHEIQRERAKWLARVAKLSRRYRVLVTGNIYGEEYVRLMNRAKIVFNRSIRGEINMRAYEAPACGALMFYERENPEIRNIYRDREECVLYGDDDLEELIDYYLTHDEERARITEAGYCAVHKETHDVHLTRLLDTIEQNMTARESPRPFVSLPAAERVFRRACQWMVVSDRRYLAQSDEALAEAQCLGHDAVEIANARACLSAEMAARLPAGSREASAAWASALGAARQAAAARPSRAAARRNLAHIYLLGGDVAAAKTELEQALRLLRAGDIRPDDLRGPYFPRAFDSFLVEIERVWGEYVPGSEEWAAAMRGVLRWNICETLSDLAFEDQDFPTAVELAFEAVSIQPDIGGTRHRFARSMRALGRVEEAIAEYFQALQDAPLTPAVWLELAELLRDADRAEELNDFLNDTLAIIDGCPYYEQMRGPLESLRDAASDISHSPYAIRLLALPDWSDDDDWQPLIAAYVREFKPDEPISLTLRLDPDRFPSTDDVLTRLERYLTADLGVSPDRIPDVTLHSEPLRPEDRWKLFRQADVVILRSSADNDLTGIYAGAAGIPIVTIDRIEHVRDLAAARVAA